MLGGVGLLKRCSRADGAKFRLLGAIFDLLALGVPERNIDGIGVSGRWERTRVRAVARAEVLGRREGRAPCVGAQRQAGAGFEVRMLKCRSRDLKRTAKYVNVKYSPR